jgi:putative hydrolases of HD superfamily
MSDSHPNASGSVDINALLSFIARAERLEALPRTGWLVCGIERPESVAAHSYVVTLIALWIADHLDEPVDTERVLRIALFHDVPEAILTDLPGPIKKRIGAAAVAAAEGEAAKIILDEACPGWSAFEASYRDQDCLEARIVKAADRIQMVAKAIQYHRQHRGDVRRFLNLGPHDALGIPLVAAIFDALEERLAQGSWPEADFD